MKIKLMLPIFLSLLATQTYAGQDRGGGDTCENRIQVIRDDLKSWIKNGEVKEFKFPKGINLEIYKARMLKAFNQTKISCVGKGDLGYPISVTREKTPKVCKFEVKEDKAKISCDFEKFTDTSNSDQYALIHHEFAGIAGLEKPNEDVSSYTLSNQIAGYLVEATVTKLSVNLSNEDLAKKEILEKFLKEANAPKTTIGIALADILEDWKGLVDSKSIISKRG